MANPADELYEIFRYWRSIRMTNGTVPTQVKVARLMDHDQAESAWIRQRKAARSLEAIEQIIDRMEESGDDVTSEREYFTQWLHAVYAYPGGWSANGAGISDSAFSTLGLFRNSARRFLPELGEDFLGELRRLLENEPELVPPQGEYPVELFAYFNRVKQHLRWCVDNYDATSQFDLQRAAEEYRSAVFMMANGAFVQNPRDWARHAAATFGIPVFRRLGSAIRSEGENQLARAFLREIGGAARLAIEAGS